MPDFSDSTDFLKILQHVMRASPMLPERTPKDPYSLCWCGSGKKWKFCHKDREKQAPVPIGQQFKNLLADYRSGPCLHPAASNESCSSPSAIRSHTIQRRGGLAFITENGHVYSLKAGFQDIVKNDGVVSPKLTSSRDASTFPGFCNHHDTEMFRSVETADAVLDEWNAFLLSFRSIAYELASKQAQLMGISRKKDEVDRGQPFEKQVEVQTFLSFNEIQAKRGLEDVSLWKTLYDKAYLSQDLQGFSFYCLSFDDVLPFVASGAFMPEFDFSGRVLQRLNTPFATEHLAVNITVLGERTVAVFCWIEGPSRAASLLVDALAEIPDERKADAVLLLAIEHLENLYFKPSWWDGLDADSRDLLDSKIGGGLLIRSQDALVEPSMEIFRIGVISTLDQRLAELHDC